MSVIDLLTGKPLRYLIGGDDSYEGTDDEIIELSYDAKRPPVHGIGVKYGNLFLEKYAEMTAAERARYAPYLKRSDTAQEYNEGQIDPSGHGWFRNLDEQFALARKQGFEIIELDNPDAYDMSYVLGAVNDAFAAGLHVLAKNPGICQGSRIAYVEHPAIVGIVVERDCGTPERMNDLRQAANKSALPVWFVAFGKGQTWADRMAEEIVRGQYVNMGVTYSSVGEYRNSRDVLEPNSAKVP